MIKQITVNELQDWKNANKSFQLIDVREPHEKEIADIGGELIPLGTIPNELGKINQDKIVVVYCRSGKRSGDAVNFIQAKLGLQEIYNLEGGILAWSDQIDQSITKY